MRRRSFTGPLMLLLVGGVFLWSNLHPQTPIFEMVAVYWPFILIVWGLLRLVEVLALRNDSARGGFTGGEVVLVIFICIAGLGVWGAHRHGIRFDTGGFGWWGEPYDYPVSARHPAAGMKRIVFENPRGNIKVTGADDAQEVVVNGHKTIRAYSHADADHTNESTPIEIVPQGDHLLIRTNQDRAPDNQRISDDLEVTVPHGTSVEARTRSGDLEIADVNGEVDLATDRGDVRLARLGGDARLDVGRSDLIRAVDLKGKLDLQGKGSDVELENIGGQVTINGAYMGTLDFKNLSRPLQFSGARNTELNVEAVPGRISMDLGEFTANNVTGPLKLVTNSRDIKIEDFTHSLEVETQRGDIELTPGHAAMPTIEARSGIGRIDLILPPGVPFQLEATAEHGEAVNDYGSQIQKDTEGRTATLRGKVGEGPTMRLTANRGSISVRKEGTPPSDIPDTPQGKHPKTPRNLKETETKM
jgi:DUF4097 and DUF4098 domain-containing protein YvlB